MNVKIGRRLVDHVQTKRISIHQISAMIIEDQLVSTEILTINRIIKMRIVIDQEHRLLMERKYGINTIVMRNEREVVRGRKNLMVKRNQRRRIRRRIMKNLMLKRRRGREIHPMRVKGIRN